MDHFLLLECVYIQDTLNKIRRKTFKNKIIKFTFNSVDTHIYLEKKDSNVIHSFTFTFTFKRYTFGFQVGLIKFVNFT
jgi:hypothetical protein